VESLFKTAPQNPYIFAALVILAVISAWQPLSRIYAAIRSFYKDVIHSGFRRAVERIADFTDRKAATIVSNPAHGTLLVLADFRTSMTLALNAAFMFLLAVGVSAVEPATNSELEHYFRKYFVAFAFLIGSLATLVWMLEALLQASVMEKVRKKLRSK
jgi:hypothetical protein